MPLQIAAIIAGARRARGLTQEALAAQVGVSAAAVSKWETAASYPDITLLPPLARALGLSMDELLGFRADPAADELTALTARLRTVFDQQGYPAGARAAQAVLREYPSSGSVKLIVGSLYLHHLAAALLRAPNAEQTEQALRTRCLALFEQAAHDCTDARERLTAQILQINALTLLGRCDEAAALIDDLPRPQSVDADALRLDLCLAQDELEQAGLLAQRTLLRRVSEVSTALTSLVTVARRQQHWDEAARLIDACTAMDELFGLDRSGSALLRLTLALDRNDHAAALDAVEQFVEARLAYTLDYRANPFFAGAQTTVPTAQAIADLRRLTLRMLEEDDSYAPLRDAPRFRAALDRLRAALPPEG